MKPRMYGNPYRTLKDSRRYLSAEQYLTMKGQIRAGKGDDAMRGLRRLMERRQNDERG